MKAIHIRQRSFGLRLKTGSAIWPAIARAVALLAIMTATAAHAGSKTTLYTFTGGSDGANPRGQLIAAGDGGYYGIAVEGGLVNCVDGTVPEGCGVVFKVKPPAKKGGAWTETVLYSFTGGSDGGSPVGLVLGKDGKTLFGTTFGYQTNDEGGGVIFQLSPPAVAGGAWTETVLHHFVYGLVTTTNTDGGDPESAPIVGPDGTLYGTTLEGGPSIAACPTDRGGCGTVWQLKPPYGPGNYSLVYAFKGGSDGSDDPRGVAITATGSLVGTNINGGANGLGYFYELTPPATTAPPGTQWKETVIYSSDATFSGNGASPPVIGPKGEILETSAAGGPYGNGNLYYFLSGKKSPTWGPYQIGIFNGSDGNAPDSPVVGPINVSGNSTFFGTTASDGQTSTGSTNGCGTVYGTIPLKGTSGGGQTYLVYTFLCGNDGATPAGVVAGPKSTLLGVASAGGAHGAGTVFQISQIGQ